MALRWEEEPTEKESYHCDGGAKDRNPESIRWNYMITRRKGRETLSRFRCDDEVSMHRTFNLPTRNRIQRQRSHGPGRTLTDMRSSADLGTIHGRRLRDM